MFAPFLAADGLTVSEFVHREVEPLDKEVEQVLSLSRSLAALRFKSRRCLCGRALKRGGGECAFRPTTSTLYLMFSASENKKKGGLTLDDSVLTFKLVLLTK